jgi:enoyl-CoA hydratase/3-hydroxyacyl-CoA dehydrogenase
MCAISDRLSHTAETLLARPATAARSRLNCPAAIFAHTTTDIMSPATPDNPLLLRFDRALPRRVAIVGAGTIGPDIGYYLKSEIADLGLRLIDVRQQALDAALERFENYARKGLERGKLKPAQAEGVIRDLIATTDYDALADCDWVIEAATEDLALKRRIFAQIEERVSAEAVITSNTSSLPAERLFAQLRHPERATVTHFFAPAWRNPAVEVVEWAQVAPETVAYLRWLFCLTGKVPMVTRDVVCFMLDRIFDNWCNEAALLLECATAGEIDAVATELAQVGPFFVLNMANGNPIIIEANTLQADEEGEHYRPAPIFRSVQRWQITRPAAAPEENAEKAAAIRDRLRGVLISQAVDILDREIGAPADLDRGCRLALGFRTGPLELMRTLGADETQRILDRLARERPGFPMPHRALDAYHDFRRVVLVDDVGDVKLITICRPDALNAIHDGVTDEILAVIREHEDDPKVAGFVITGYGPRAFSAGADIGRFPAMLGDPERSVEYARECSRLLVHLDQMDKPVVAALNGMALGGGLELAMRCHGLVARERAFLQFPEITLGIVPGIGAMVVPYRRWPEASETFHAMLRQAHRLDAATARKLGVVDALASDYRALIDAAVDRVHALAGKPKRIPDEPVAIAPLAPCEPVAANGQPLSREVIGIMERAIAEAAAASTLTDALEIGYRAFGASACTAAAREGIGAFQARRTPDFSETG